MYRIFFLLFGALLLSVGPAAAMVNKKQAPAENKNNSVSPLPEKKAVVESAALQAQQTDTPGDRLAVMSLLFGIGSLVFFIVGIFIGPFAIGFGLRALRLLSEENSTNRSSRNSAIAGIVMGAAAILGGLLIVLLLFLL